MAQILYRGIGILLWIGMLTGCGAYQEVSDPPNPTSPPFETNTSLSDTTPPVITLNGLVELNITQGESYTDAGATAWDDRDGDLTDRITVTDPVDTATVGIYTVTYSVSDAAGNQATATRTVHVVADTNKKIFLIGDSTMRYDFDGDRDSDGPLHRTGWGSKLSVYLLHPENVFNRARRAAIAGGIEENVNSYRRIAPIDPWIAENKGPYDWNTTRALIEESNVSNGGFLLIQFGANDKYNDVNETAFKSHLKYYIDAARGMGIVPILVTPINPKSTLTDTRTPYTGYIKDVAADENVPVIDLHTRSLEVYAQYTLEQRYGLFGAWKLDGTRDTTHLDRQGATIVADWVADSACTQLQTQELCDQFDHSRAFLYAYAGEDLTLTPGQSVDLSGSGLDTDGEVVRYEWSEDGKTLSTDPALHFQRLNVGTYTLTLTVWDDMGNTATDQITITIANEGIVLEDAEDGNTSRWNLYAEEEGSSITNIFDDERSSRVIQFQGEDGLDNGFAFRDINLAEGTVLSWALNYHEDFRFFVKICTTNSDHDPLYMTYQPDATAPTYEEISGKQYIHIGLGSIARSGEWIDIERDIQADLQTLFPDENMTMLYGIFIRGSGRIDDIVLREHGGKYPAQSDFFARSTVAVDLPDLNSSFKEPVFGTNVTRITDRANQTANVHPYPKQGSAWNSDATIIRMQYRLYDAKTFEELPVTAGLDADHAYAKVGSPWHGAADIRWSKSDPNVMYVLDSSQRFKRVVINADRTDATSEAPMLDMSSLGYSNITTGNNEGNLDYSDSYVIFAAQKENNESVLALMYHLGESNLTWTKEVPRGVWNGDAEHYFDWISVDPTAHYIVMNAEEKTWLYDMNLSNEVKLDDYAGHGDIGIDVNGDPVYVQMIYGGTAIRSYNLRTHEALDLLPSNYGGGHISCRNYQRPGWCYVNTSEEGYKEVFALKLDDHVSGVVERYAQTHVSYDNRGATQVNVSPDGTKVLFGSDWGDTDNAVDTYHVEIKW